MSQGQGSSHQNPGFHPNDPNSRQQDPLLVVKIIWGALCGSVLMYFFVAQTVISSHLEGAEPQTLTGENSQLVSPSGINPLFIPLAVAGVISLALAFYLPKLLCGQKKSGAASAAVPQTREILQKKYLVAFILRMALTESVVIYGLILSILSNDIKYFVYFLIPVGVVFLMSFPNQENLKKIIGEEAVSLRRA